MTNQQLRLVIGAVETGSISAAAEKLHISQPNASLSIKKLEKELGYTLFRREGGGIYPTEQGYLFLEHAQRLLEEDNAVRAIGNSSYGSRLRLDAMNYSPAVDAFMHLCHEKKDSPHGEYSCINTSPQVGTRLLKERKLDVMITILLKEAIPITEKSCHENMLELIRIGTIPVCIRLRKGHPLLENGRLDGTAKGYRLLSDYPFVEYVYLENLMSEYNQTAKVPFGCTYKIFVDERESRLRVLQETDAYSVGIQIPEEKLERYGLASIPIGRTATLYACIRKGDEGLSDIKRYIELLREESAQILSP